MTQFPTRLGDKVQSPYLYLQSAGSDGTDGSTPGVHVRWILAGNLGATHLPKGDAPTIPILDPEGKPATFNRDSDYVRLYRSAYDNEFSMSVRLRDPNVRRFKHDDFFWILDGKPAVYLHFRSRERYASILETMDPATNPDGFLEQYCPGVLELELMDQLFFDAVIRVIGGPDTVLRVEALSVTENVPRPWLSDPAQARKDLFVSFRRTFRDGTWCNGEDCRARAISENIHSIRFAVENGMPSEIRLESYLGYRTRRDWEPLGEFALTDDRHVAWERLEPYGPPVDNQWKKFNGGALVRTDNYRERWRDGLADAIVSYLDVTKEQEPAPLKPPGPGESASIDYISHLDALRVVSLDFHAARMLGLGLLDHRVNEQQSFIYLAVYQTDGPLDDGNGARSVTHYFMGVPTRMSDLRLPEPPLLMPVVYGLKVGDAQASGGLLTDEEGYTPDGVARYVNLFVEPEKEGEGAADERFVRLALEPDDGIEKSRPDFSAIDRTAPVFYGVEYRTAGEQDWRQPELAHDDRFADTRGVPEPLPLPNNADSTRPILIHDEKENGIHEYGAYAINWFSRASDVGTIVATDETRLKKPSSLLPPSNLMVQLIQKESPLMLTTQAEQVFLDSLKETDKTLVRVTFDYDHVHDRNYAFADSVELFFRPEIPRNVVGAILSVTTDSGHAPLAVLRTGDYLLRSEGISISPKLDSSLYTNFIGGVLSCKNENYVIVEIATSGVAGEGPVFTIRKNVKSTPIALPPPSTEIIFKNEYVTKNVYVMPEVTSLDTVVFMATENMANPLSWGAPNPLTAVKIGHPWWVAHEETYQQDGAKTLELRGFHGEASVVKDGALDGLYRIEFTGLALPDHPQHADTNPVDWYKGTLRVNWAKDPDQPRKVLDVLWIASRDPLTLIAQDEGAKAGDAATGNAVSVTWYPGYRVYLKADPTSGFDEQAIYPSRGEGTRKTWLGARSWDSSMQYASPVGIPAPIVAVEHIEPARPSKPDGLAFATRPDYYFKSTYTFRIHFDHEPFSVALYRSNDTAILRALYCDDTLRDVQEQLKTLGVDDLHRADRWMNLVSLNYQYDDPENPFHDPTGTSVNGTFLRFPVVDGYAFPNPDRPAPDNLGKNPDHYPAPPSFSGKNPGDVMEEMRAAIWGAFTALTELPLIFDLIKGETYQPVPKAQRIRDAQGRVLDPNHAEFDLSPMAKRTENPNEIHFTDFTLDGAGSNLFFYCGREIGNRGQLGQPGDIAGPIRLINTRPPEAPAVRSVYVRPPNFAKDPATAVHFEVNTYPAVESVARMLIYRLDADDKLSIRDRVPVKSVDLEASGQLTAASFQVADDFEDGEVPYGDPLYYRLVALRKIIDRDGSVSWVPSPPSKPILTTVADTVNPDAPVISVVHDGIAGDPPALINVTLSWLPTTHNGTYYLDKMTASGRWENIHCEASNSAMTIKLSDLRVNLPKELEAEVSAGNAKQFIHRFRVRVQNSSGLVNLSDRVLMV